MFNPEILYICLFLLCQQDDIDDIENILNQRDIYGQAELAKDVYDELFEYFKYVVREEGLTHPPEDWSQARDMYEKIVQLAEA